ncbi:RTX toxin [Mesorhizobium sp.]|uniref:RTX toxin n=1 Tax=Mesorhizobium sp. TaxID=1871066 RepID=UPI0025F00632|nr:RTX toxin [Mesorhizobium sp.]
MAKLPELPWGDAKLLMTEFGIDAWTEGDWLNIDNWTQPSEAASGSEIPRELSELGDGLAAETGKGSHTASFDPAANQLDLVSAHGITPTWESEGGLKLAGLTEAAAGLGIHLDSTFFDTLAVKASGLWHNVEKGHADSFLTSTTNIPEAVADIGMVSTLAAVTTSSLLAASSTAIDPIFETRVAAAGDDVEEKGSGSISSNISDLELGYDSSTRQTVGIRFTGIDIPQGAIITSAYIQFQANEVKTGATSLLIKGEDTDDASAFTSVSFNVSSRATTDASIAWTPDPWTTVGAHGLAERSPDLSTIVQEIVNRSGWAALNDMAFLVTGTGTRTADSYEYSATSAPLLHIEYLLPGSGDPVAFNAPPDADPIANQIAELAAVGALTGITASATDPDAGSTVTYSINDSRFAIDSSSGVITRSATGTLDFETQPSINLTVKATSSDGSTANQVFTLAVLNSPEPVAFNTQPDADTAANQITQNAAAGTAVGITASAKDPDAGSTVTYTIDDTRFAINSSTGIITRSGTGTLNATSEPSVALTVTAKSSDGSTDTHTFNVNVTANQLPVAFNSPPDANAAANQIAELAAAGAATGITASATDPDAGSTVIYSLNDSRFAINSSTGVITRSSTGTLNAQSEPSVALTVTATSSDGSIDTHAFNLNVTASQLPTSVTLAHTVQTSLWSPPSPDPTDIVYISHLGTLLVADSEVEEMSIFTGKNLYQTTLSGNLMGTLTTINFSDEPAGIAYNPSNHHLFFADDTGTKSVYELNPGKDGLYNTSDDIVTSFKTSAFGSTDPESVAYDTKRGVLYVADGSTHNIYTVAPGQNGKFDGVASTGGDDIVTSFSASALGTPSDESIAYDPVNDLLYIIQSRNSVAMVTTTGELLGTLDISSANAKKPAGLALAPSSDDPSHHMSLYIVDRGVDNDSNPTENDGKIYEFHFNDWLV